MKIADIFLYGDIFNEQSEYAGDWGVVSLTDVMNQVKKAGKVDRLLVHVHSRGGDVNEGFAIHDYLVNTGLEVHTIIEGFCASIATAPFLAGSVRQMTSNSNLMIHNPWGGAMGDAEEMRKYADYLEEKQDMILDFYASKTNTKKKVLSKMMDDETEISADEAEKMGFATEVVETMKAVAYLNPNIKKKSKMKKELNSIQKVLKSIQDKLDGKTDEPKNLALTAVDGTKLEIESESTTPQVGDSIKADGKDVAEASYLMPEKETIVVKDGKISEIQEPVDKKKETKDAKAAELEATVAKLKTANETLEAENKENKKALEALNTSVEAIAKQIVPGFEIPAAQAVNHSSGKKIETEAEGTPAAQAIQRRKDKKAAAKAEAK